MSFKESKIPFALPINDKEEDCEIIHYKDHVYLEALSQWGVEKQLYKLVEELSELIKEISKHLNGQGDLNHIAEEIADVSIMLEQTILFLDLGDEVYKHTCHKLLRLQNRLKNQKEEKQKDV